jgi:magnesium transporter
MIRAYAHDNGKLRLLDAPFDPAQAIWIDLINPDPAETQLIATTFAVELPTREDMAEIETSSRLYQEGDAAFMTATLPAGADSGDPEMAPVTFALTPERLITLRHHEPRPFVTYPQRAQQAPIGCGTAQGALLGLLDEIIDRLADLLERIGRDIELISRMVFRNEDGPQGKGPDFRDTLRTIGRTGDFLSKIRESLVSLDRVLAFLTQLTNVPNNDRETRGLIKTLSRDEQSLTQHADFLSQKITLLLDATLGMIDIEQSGIIKIVSVAAVEFMPPTLVASIYGMNFEAMPELGWRFGYPLALGLMIVSAILPYLFFKRRGWL